MLMLVLLSACEQAPVLERIQHTGKLLVAIQHGGSRYYNTPAGADGFEFELLKRFAASLQLPLELRFYQSEQQITKALQQDDVYMAAGNLFVNEKKQRQLRFSTPYHETEQILLYRMGNRQPKEVADMQRGKLEIVHGSHQEQLLKQIRRDSLPTLNWITAEQDHRQIVLPRLNDGKIHFTITGRQEYELVKPYYPYILPGIAVSEVEPVAWAFSRRFDDSLLQAANQFLAQLVRKGELQTLKNKYFHTIEPRDFVAQRDFWRRVKSRLPKYESLFQKAAEETKIDWLMLAAIGYQESHWDPHAVSPTGVKGIMMLTKAAAKQLKMTDRTDPEQSIVGGARYLLWKAAKIPERIQGEDRLWLTLAAYNVGFGHLEDARILTQRQGGNPDLWEDVKQRLPLLSKKKYYETLKRGRARGQEPVTYVENIRYYHQLLTWYYFQSPERAEGNVAMANGLQPVVTVPRQPPATHQPPPPNQ